MRVKFLILLVLIAALLGICGTAQSIEVEPTMEKMSIYILQVELVKDDGSLVTIFSGEKEINPDAANPGDVIGDIIQGASVPVGTYTSVRVTMSRLGIMKMYLDIPGTGRVMQTTSSGIQQGFGEPPTVLDPSNYSEFRFILPENPETGMSKDGMQAAPAGATPSSIGSFVKSPPEGAFPPLTVEKDKTTTLKMGFGGGAPDQGFGPDGGGGGSFSNPAKDSDYTITPPQ